MEMFLVLLEPREGGSDDEAAHRVPHHANFRNVGIFTQFVVDLSSQAHAHGVDISLSSALVGRGGTNSHPSFIISLELYFQFLHI
jgi:hypothetical protein